jgi:hypothetical protein
VIRDVLTQAGPPEAPGPRERKHLRNPSALEAAVLLAPIDLRPRSPVIRSSATQLLRSQSNSPVSIA